MSFDPTHMPLIELNNGQKIPQVGLGVYKLAAASAADLVATAIETGYRRIDTAALYANEAEVGEGIRQSSVPREDIYVTTKIWHDHHGYDEALVAIDESLDIGEKIKAKLQKASPLVKSGKKRGKK